MFFKNAIATLSRDNETKTTQQDVSIATKTFNTSISDDVIIRKSRPSILRRRDDRAARRAAHW